MEPEESSLGQEQKIKKLKNLTPREWEILCYTCEYKHLQLKEIVKAKKILKPDGRPIVESTLISHLQKIYGKLLEENQRDVRTLEREYYPLIEPLKSYKKVSEPKLQDLLSGLALYANSPLQNDVADNGKSLPSVRLAEQTIRQDMQPLEAASSWRYLQPRIQNTHRWLSPSIGLLALCVVAILTYISFFSSPPSQSCDSLEITSSLFPQLAGITSQYPFYDHEHSHVFKCQIVRDLVYTPPLAVKLSFSQPETSYEYGYFGIGRLDGFDASKYSKLCFRGYVIEPGQRFWLNLKDTKSKVGGDARISVLLNPTNSWEETCVDLQEYAKQGAALNTLENVNIGFDIRTGAAIVWVDSFEFRN